MFSAREVTIEVGGRTLLRDGAFVVGTGQKVALVGANGQGKSSLLSFLLGSPLDHLKARGDISSSGTIGFLPQVPVPGGLGVDSSVLSHVLSSRGLDVLDDELHRTRRQLAESPTDELVARFAALEERFRMAGGYELESRLARLADGLGLPQEFLLADVDSLSGGQRRRVDLIRVLFGEPDLMVLDEPTNHLDRSAKLWLMDELAERRGALLLVSHDVRLLDHAIDKVLYLADGVLREFKGNYSAFRRELEADIERREKVSGAEAVQIAKMQAQADKFRHSTEAQARKAKILDRKVAKMQANRTELIKRDRRVTFKLPEPVRSGGVVIGVHGLGVAYGDHKVLLDVDFVVDRGDRVAVIGRNGAGKSSLLRCLSGIQDPTQGSVELGYRVQVGYFAQEHEQIDLASTPLDNLDDTVVTKDADRRSVLGAFGLSGESATRAAGSLSGGERARLSLAMLAASRANLLILDEPTNNLDPGSLSAIGAMFGAWPGTIVAVSHDRAFVEALAPTHALHLPAERYGFWRDEYLDDVEVR